MIDIAIWLRAQFDADEYEALEAKRRAEDGQRVIVGELVGMRMGTPAEWRRSIWSPDRVLADVVAKRRFVDRCAQLVRYAEAQSAERRAQLLPYLRAFEVALRDLAASYSDWPGYDPDWAPDKLQLDM